MNTSLTHSLMHLMHKITHYMCGSHSRSTRVHSLFQSIHFQLTIAYKQHVYILYMPINRLYEFVKWNHLKILLNQKYYCSQTHTYPIYLETKFIYSLVTYSLRSFHLLNYSQYVMIQINSVRIRWICLPTCEYI